MRWPYSRARIHEEPIRGRTAGRSSLSTTTTIITIAGGVIIIITIGTITTIIIITAIITIITTTIIKTKKGCACGRARGVSARSVSQNSLKEGIEIGRRTRNNLQNVSGCSLLPKRFIPLACKPRDLGLLTSRS
jgi:hypothetical protein